MCINCRNVRVDKGTKTLMKWLHGKQEHLTGTSKGQNAVRMEAQVYKNGRNEESERDRSGSAGGER